MESMKLKDVPGGRVFSYLASPDRYFKLRKNNSLKPPTTAPSLTELAAKFGEGEIMHFNPESQVVVHEYD